jgi:hypothetical protein
MLRRSQSRVYHIITDVRCFIPRQVTQNTLKSTPKIKRLKSSFISLHIYPSTLPSNFLSQSYPFPSHSLPISAQEAFTHTTRTTTHHTQPPNPIRQPVKRKNKKSNKKKFKSLDALMPCPSSVRKYSNNSQSIQSPS